MGLLKVEERQEVKGAARLTPGQQLDHHAL